MSPDPYSERNETSVDSALAMSASLNWMERAAAIRLLANHIGDPRARAQLVQGLSDSDTAVVVEATELLVRDDGIRGMRDVLSYLAISEDDAGYHIRDRLVEMWLNGYPVLDIVQEVLREEPPGPIRQGASEMLDLLEAP